MTVVVVNVVLVVLNRSVLTMSQVEYPGVV